MVKHHMVHIPAVIAAGFGIKEPVLYFVTAGTGPLPWNHPVGYPAVTTGLIQL